MIYGQCQYYNDELNCWRKNIALHKDELQESVRQMATVMDHPVVTPANEKIRVDQLMVQDQQFDNITNQIIGQKQRVERTVSYPDKPIDVSVSDMQDSLLMKVRNAERNFSKTKYSCSMHLSSLLSNTSFAFRINNADTESTATIYA